MFILHVGINYWQLYIYFLSYVHMSGLEGRRLCARIQAYIHTHMHAHKDTISQVKTAATCISIAKQKHPWCKKKQG